MDLIFLIALLPTYLSARVSVRQGLVSFSGCAHLEIFVCVCIFVALKIISIIYSTFLFCNVELFRQIST